MLKKAGSGKAFFFFLSQRVTKILSRYYCLVFLLLLFSPNAVLAADIMSRTLTINVGQGVNNGANRNLNNNNNDRGITCVPNSSGGNADDDDCEKGQFGNTSDPFTTDMDCNTFTDPSDPCNPFDMLLSSGFDLVDNQFGATAPCGPNDPNPSFYPCNSPGSINQQVSVGMNFNQILMLPPTLGSAGAPFQRYTSSIDGSGNRTHHIEYGFDFTVSGGGSQDIKLWFVIDSTTDSNGALIGNASGTFIMFLDDNGEYESNCHVDSADPSSSGTFTAGASGLITCLDSGSNVCPNVQQISNIFDTGQEIGDCSMVP